MIEALKTKEKIKHAGLENRDQETPGRTET